MLARSGFNGFKSIDGKGPFYQLDKLISTSSRFWLGPCNLCTHWIASASDICITSIFTSAVWIKRTRNCLGIWPKNICPTCFLWDFFYNWRKLKEWKSFARRLLLSGLWDFPPEKGPSSHHQKTRTHLHVFLYITLTHSYCPQESKCKKGGDRVANPSRQHRLFNPPRSTSVPIS